MTDVQIQFEDQSRMWRTVAIVSGEPQKISIDLRSVRSRYPNSRVRALSKDGQLLDLIG
jgi:hypothetical protein